MTILISFFFNFRKKRKLDFINLFFVFFSISIPFYSLHSHPNSLHSHPDSSHFHPDSLHSHPDSPYSSNSQHSLPHSPRSHSDSPRSYPDSALFHLYTLFIPFIRSYPHSVPRFFIPAFTDSHLSLNFLFLVGFP